MPMFGPSRNDRFGPELSHEILRRIDVLFLPEDRPQAQHLLFAECGNKLPGPHPEIERCRVAALKYSDGDLSKLERAVRLAQIDFRDLLMSTGFAHEVGAYLKWEPKPAAEPSEIDASRLAAGIHARIAAVLVPLGFARTGDVWRRNTGVQQTL